MGHPRLRAVGNYMMETMFPSVRARHEADYENDLLMKRQQALADQKFTDTILARLVNDPKMAIRAKAQGLTNVGGTPVDAFVPTDTELGAPIVDEIAKAKDLPSLGSKQGRFEQRRTAGPITSLSDISNLLNTYDAQRGQINENDATAIDQAGAKSQAEAYGTGTGQNIAANESLPDVIRRENTKENETRGAKVQTAGDTAFAQGSGQARGAFPYSTPQFLFDKTGDSHAFRFGPHGAEEQTLPPGFSKEDPTNDNRLSAGQKTQRDDARSARIIIGDVKNALSEMNKRGLQGPIASRYADLAAGTIKAEQLFSNPQDAQLASQFISEMGLLTSLAARVHGGARGAASPMMHKIFEKIVSGIGSKENVLGQLDAVDRVMQIYEKDPNAPALIALPGVGPDTSGPAELDPSIAELLRRPNAH